MKFWKRLTACALTAAMAAGFAGCGSSGGDASKKEGSGKEDAVIPYDSDFTIGVDKIAEAMGAGWNVGNQLEANSGGKVNETVWGNPEITQELISAVADAGFTTVRVPVSYLDRIDDANGYQVDSAWLDRVEEVVQYCYNEGLYVIINMHGDGYNSIDGGWFLVNGEDQDMIREKYEAVWKQIAERFAKYDEHLIFESMNEEFDGTYDGDPNKEYYANLNQYNQIFVDTVRGTGEKNTHRWLLVPGWNTNIEYTVGDYGFEMPTDEKCSAGESRMMVSVHYYDPWDYCGTEDLKTILWGEYGDNLIEVNGFPKMNKAKWGDESYLDDLFSRMQEKFVKNDIPVIIGEYGCIDKSSAYADFAGQIQGNRAYWDGYVAGKAASMGMIPVYWDNGFNGVYGFGLFDRNTYEQTQPEIISTILKAVKNKDPKAGLDTVVENKVEKTDEAHAYIGIQTEVYTFRNSCSDAKYGKDTDYFNTLIKWGEDDQIIDTGAKFTDATISADGTYTVSVDGYDFSSDSSKLNMLFVSTDFAFNNTLKVSDVVVKCDDQEIPIDKPLVMADDQGNFYMELVNIYNTDLAALDYTMPKNSFSVTFTIEGMDSVLAA